MAIETVLTQAFKIEINQSELIEATMKVKNILVTH